MHEHGCPNCPHDKLEYCKDCQRVYCSKCGQEWGQGYYYTGTINYPITWECPSTQTCDSHEYTHPTVGDSH